MEAAAATLLVVVPAKPLRAKHRFAALRISSRRKSLVIRRVLIVVSKHSLVQMSSRFAAVREHVSRTRCGILHAAPQSRDPWCSRLRNKMGPGSAAHRFAK